MKRSQPEQQFDIIKELKDTRSRMTFRLPESAEKQDEDSDDMQIELLSEEQIEKILQMEDKDFMRIKTKFSKEEWR